MLSPPPAAGIVRLPIVGVMGSAVDAHAERARQVGRWIAAQGYHLLTGGGDGVMGAVTEAFVSVRERAGASLAVVPCLPGDAAATPLPGYPNRWVEIPIFTHLDTGRPAGDAPSSRNHLNVLSSTVIIFLPGGSGTASEARLALRYGRPGVAYLHAREELPELPAGIPVEAEFERVAEFVRQQAGARVNPRAAGARPPTARP
ncbi:MAG: molybdenum cofactor carrier protein [Acidobacteria bacterium]|nr:molybdenum cofactor carrier protein [Acidobacteriota bacterium]